MTNFWLMLRNEIKIWESFFWTSPVSASCVHSPTNQSLVHPLAIMFSARFADFFLLSFHFFRGDSKYLSTWLACWNNVYSLKWDLFGTLLLRHSSSDYKKLKMFYSKHAVVIFLIPFADVAFTFFLLFFFFLARCFFVFSRTISFIWMWLKAKKCIFNYIWRVAT